MLADLLGITAGPLNTLHRHDPQSGVGLWTLQLDSPAVAVHLADGTSLKLHGEQASTGNASSVVVGSLHGSMYALPVPANWLQSTLPAAAADAEAPALDDLQSAADPHDLQADLGPLKAPYFDEFSNQAHQARSMQGGRSRQSGQGTERVYLHSQKQLAKHQQRGQSQPRQQASTRLGNLEKPIDGSKRSSDVSSTSSKQHTSPNHIQGYDDHMSHHPVLPSDGIGRTVGQQHVKSCEGDVDRIGNSKRATAPDRTGQHSTALMPVQPAAGPGALLQCPVSMHSVVTSTAPQTFLPNLTGASSESEQILDEQQPNSWLGTSSTLSRDTQRTIPEERTIPEDLY